MSLNLKTDLVVLGLIAVFAAGRYTAQYPKVQTKTDIQVSTDTKVDQDKHKETTSVTEKRPDGTTTTTTKTTEETETKKHTDKESVTHIDQTVTSSSTLNVSALVGLDLSRQAPVYGVSLNKQFIGPLTVGVYGLTNGTIGVSIGLNF